MVLWVPLALRQDEPMGAICVGLLRPQTLVFDRQTAVNVVDHAPRVAACPVRDTPADPR